MILRHSIPMDSSAFEPNELTTVTWLSGAGFLINTHGTCLMIDPVLSTLPDSEELGETGLRLRIQLPLRPELVPETCTVLYTHPDSDHLGPLTAQLLAKNHVKMIGTLAVFERLVRLGIPPEQIEVLRTEETMEIAGIQIESIPADHPWQLKDRKRGGRPYRDGDCCGYILNTPEGRLYFPGDTRLMERHFRIQNIDLLALDVSTCEYHLGHTSAVVLANLFPSAWLMPYHYGTYDAPGVAAHIGEPEDVYPLIAGGKERGLILAAGERFILNNSYFPY